jgi:ankyrin repeat protein
MLALFAEIDDIRFQDSPPGDTPPVHMLSLWHGEPSLAILTALVQHGADINARDDQGRTFVHHYLERAAVPDRTTLRAWRSLGFDFSLRDALGRTPADTWNARTLGDWAIASHDRLRALQVECEEEHVEALAGSLA